MTAQRDPDDLYDESVEPTRFELRATECNRELAKALRDFVDAAERGATTFFDMRGSCLRNAKAALKKCELSL